MASNPYKQYAGYVDRKPNPYTGSWNVLYMAEEQGLDPDGGRWVTVCEVHGALCNHETKKLAMYHLDSADWCEECMAIADNKEKVMTEIWIRHIASIKRYLVMVGYAGKSPLEIQDFYYGHPWEPDQEFQQRQLHKAQDWMNYFTTTYFPAGTFNIKPDVEEQQTPLG